LTADLTILPTPSEPFRATLCRVTTKLATSTTAAVTTSVPFDPRSIPPQDCLAHMHGWTVVVCHLPRSPVV